MAAKQVFVILLGLVAVSHAFSIIGLNASAMDDVMMPDSIIGGFPVNIERVPHQLFMLAGEYSCGAAIISSRWALTAGHCCVVEAQGFTRPYRPRQVNLRSGTSDRGRGGVVHDVVQLRVHPEYSPRTLDNDICAVQVGMPFGFDQRTRAIQLPAENDQELYRPGARSYVTGWGTTTFRGSPANFLMAVNLPVLSNNECRQIYRQLGMSYRITKRQVCAFRAGKASCHGDSGGALVIQNKMAGIVSGGIVCGQHPGFYTRITAFRSWISKVTGV